MVLLRGRIRLSLFTIVFIFFVALPAGLIVFKTTAGGYNLDSLVPVITYDIALDMTFAGYGDSLVVETFLPQVDDRVTIEEDRQSSDLPYYSERRESGNRVATWSGPDARGPGAVHVLYRAYAQALSYDLDPAILVPGPPAAADLPFLESTATVQADDPQIQSLAAELAPQGTPLVDGLRAIHGYCLGLDAVSFKGTTDALTTLRLGEASCNGKSRLFAALARSRGIPARLVGGLVLEPGRKRTSHQWLEVLVGSYWVPFCPTNDHFASIPANYLPLYTGDEVLFHHSRDINFDYSFRIRRQEGIRAELLQQSLSDPLNLMSVWETFRKAGIPFELLKVLLMIPLGTLVLVILRNVIGLQTFGTFLPILIAIAFRQTGLYWGLVVFVLLILLIFAVRQSIRPLGLLHIPQMAILLSFSVIFILALGAVGVKRGFLNLASVSMFPIAIMAITTERFSLMIEEEGVRETARTTLMTAVAIACCFWVMNAMAFQIMFLTFPELILVVLFLNIWLGRWIGLRVTEFWRFRHLLKGAG